MQFLKYSVIRLGIFMIVFLALWQLMSWPIFAAGLIGLIVAFAISYLFFNRLRLAAAQDVRNLFARTSSKKTARQLDDESVEDAYDERRRGNDQ